MAKSDNSTGQNDPLDEIPEEMKQDIADAVASEDGPSKTMRTTNIPVSNWENPDQKKQEQTVSEVTEDEEQADHPAWDDEKWQQANLDEEEVEQPEWDEEKWQQAKTEDGSQEHPEWDDEKWRTEDGSALDEAAVAAVEAKTTEQSDDPQTETTSTQATIKNSGDDEPMSASQAALNQDDPPMKKKRGPKQWLTATATWWQKAKVRNSAIVGFAMFLLLIITVPAPRYAVLNTVGVRAAASITVLDSETQLPLKEVDVTLAGTNSQTNQNGLASFDSVRLGTQTLTIEKSAYETITRTVTIGMGSNQFNSTELKAIGTSFEFRIVDWLTEDPIVGAEVSFAENSALTNDEGIAKLNTVSANDSSIEVALTAANYQDQSVEISTTEPAVNDVQMVISRPHLFISKRDGTFDIYRSLADGSDQTKLVSGTGNEKADSLRFDVAPNGEQAVLVATRDAGLTNDDGFVLSELFIVDIENGDLQSVDSSERIDLIGWIDNRLVYVKVQAGASGRNPERHRLVSLDLASGRTNQIAASNYFSDVIVAKNYVFYAPSDEYKQNPRPYLFRSNADGSSVETVFEGNVWTILRVSEDEILFDSNQKWYRGQIDRIFNSEAGSRPTSFTSQLYTESPGGALATRVDIRDGKGALVLVNQGTNEESVITTQAGLRDPVRWLSERHLVFRVSTPNETADYVVGVDGGEPQKISDVTNSSGIDRWYYY